MIASDQASVDKRRPLLLRFLAASGRFVSGFAIQAVTWTGTFASEDDAEDPWFRRGEVAAYVALAMLAISAVALLIFAT
jgi:hypothetical protein